MIYLLPYKEFKIVDDNNVIRFHSYQRIELGGGLYSQIWYNKGNWVSSYYSYTNSNFTSAQEAMETLDCRLIERGCILLTEEQALKLLPLL